jgi:hypothetical protein
MPARRVTTMTTTNTMNLMCFVAFAVHRDDGGGTCASVNRPRAVAKKTAGV